MTAWLALPDARFGSLDRARTGRVPVGSKVPSWLKVIMAGTGIPIASPVSQLALDLATRHSPRMSGLFLTVVCPRSTLVKWSQPGRG